jgi:acetyl-CoA carboxylase biotin carboxyl carrier protein
MDTKQIKRLISILESSSLQEIQIEENGTSIYLNKGALQQQVAVPAPVAHTVVTTAPPKISPAKEDTAKCIKSPMVGTFYRAPSPDAKPFVEVGDKVKKGDVVCIVEAMKMMNQITADISGTIAEILVDDATPVEFDHPIIRVS